MNLRTNLRHNYQIVMDTKKCLTKLLVKEATLISVKFELSCNYKQLLVLMAVILSHFDILYNFLNAYPMQRY